MPEIELPKDDQLGDGADFGVTGDWWGSDLGEDELRELRDLRNIVLCAEDDVTVKHLRDLLGWEKTAALSQVR